MSQNIKRVFSLKKVFKRHQFWVSMRISTRISAYCCSTSREHCQCTSCFSRNGNVSCKCQCCWEGLGCQKTVSQQYQFFNVLKIPFCYAAIPHTPSDVSKVSLEKAVWRYSQINKTAKIGKIRVRTRIFDVAREHLPGTPNSLPQGGRYAEFRVLISAYCRFTGPVFRQVPKVTKNSTRMSQ